MELDPRQAEVVRRVTDFFDALPDGETDPTTQAPDSELPDTDQATAAA